MALPLVPTHDDLLRELRERHIAQWPAMPSLPPIPTKTEFMGMSYEELRNRRVLHDRLRIPEGKRFPAQFCEVYETDATVFVFIVHKDRAVVLEDEADMYPSDKLIASLRLLLG